MEVKKKYTQKILKLLPEWFSIDDSLVEYIETVEKYPFFGAFINEDCVGFFQRIFIMKELASDIYIYGIHPKHHCQMARKELYKTLEQNFINQGCKYMMVKTLSLLHLDKHYALIRKFYKAVDFKAFYTDYTICRIKKIQV
jgi:hypothetical protein